MKKGDITEKERKKCLRPLYSWEKRRINIGDKQFREFELGALRASIL
jgi:hypothetical protein